MCRGDAFRKGHDVASAVFMILGRDSASADNIELWVCGNHIDETRFKYPVRNFGVVPDGRLRQILSGSDIFFYPSRHEGFGLFPLEAMACGCAVITTDAIPYARSTMGILATEIGNASELCKSLMELVPDQELLRTLQKHAIDSAGRYNVEDSKKQFEGALITILKGPVVCESA
jgi:glycosyltransferase involved in cell wall biosynthesis